MNETLKTAAGIVLGTIGLCVVLGFFFFSEKVKVERSLVDARTHCPLALPKSVWGLYEIHPPDGSGRTAVVIDATDRIPESHRTLIGAWFEEDFTKSLVRFERVAIYEVRPRKDSASPAIGDPHFDRCAPPAKANKWIENPRMIRQQFEQQFMKKKLSVIEALAAQSEARWSPILEVLAILFEDYDRIVLVSDLMQNTPECSLYRRRDGRRYQSGCALYAQTSLDKKSLDVLFLKRDKIVSLQDSALLQFWQKYMEARRGTFSVETELRIIH